MHIGKLSLVDLAGSERYLSTQKEASITSLFRFCYAWRYVGPGAFTPRVPRRTYLPGQSSLLPKNEDAPSRVCVQARGTSLSSGGFKDTNIALLSKRNRR